MEVLSLNNRAAALAAQGKHEDAAVYLERALVAFRDILVRREIPSSCQHRDRGDSELLVKWKLVRNCCQSRGIRVLSSNHDNPSTDNAGSKPNNKTTLASKQPPSIEGAFEFYSSIFTYSLDVADGREPQYCCEYQWQKTQDLILALLTCNLGIISHHLALQQVQSFHFEKAKHFYDLSFSTIENFIQDHGYDENLVVLICALYSNMGYIHSRSHNHQDISFCLEWLTRIVAGEEFFTAPMTENDYYFFSFYMLFGRDGLQLSTAPTA